MKKFLSILCTLSIIFTLCSCKNTATSSDLNSSVSSNASSNTSSENSSLSSNSSLENSKEQNTSSDSSSQREEPQKPIKCEHSYTEATCTEPSVCVLCNNIKESALGHSFTYELCSRVGCTAKNPNWINWYTSGDVTITAAEVEQIVSNQYKKPRNVIFMIGDGMGANDIQLTERNKEGCFDFGLVLNKIKYTGYATTHSANSSVTDSAASATALATGIKTINGYVGVSPTGETLTNVSEIARQNGKKIGIVTNDYITGATPSGFTIHNISRDNSSELAKAFVNFKPDVLIGQGFSEFVSFDLSAFLVASNIEAINHTLNNDPRCQKPFMGFFSENTYSQMNNTLAYCTETAINRLKNNPKGFFLMVENAGTDKAGHKNTIKGKVNAVVNFDRAVATVLKFMKNNPDTLLVITSDHETGGVQLPQGKFLLDDSLFTTANHTGTPVRTFAIGYGAEYFHNKTVDNTDIAKFVIEAVKN